MAAKRPPRFDVKMFLAKIGAGRALVQCRKGERIFAQGAPADAVFFVQSGRVKLTVVSHRGKAAIVGLLGVGDFFGEGCRRPAVSDRERLGHQGCRPVADREGGNDPGPASAPCPR
jgi:Cyclic nucleotide-binding domain